MTGRPPYLVPVPADGTPITLPAPPRVSRMRVTPAQRQQIESARGLVRVAGELIDRHPAAYVAGLLEGSAITLLDLLDTLTEVEPRTSTSPEGAL